MSEKTVHVVFQILNFLHSEKSIAYSLNDAERLLLITLASHKGAKGIYPSLKTLSRELKKKESTVRRWTASLAQKKLIRIDRTIGISNHYVLSEVLMTPLTSEQGTHTDPAQIRADPPLTSEQGTPLTSEQLITKRNNKGITERARAPIAFDFRPDQKTKDLIKELGFDQEQVAEIGEAFVAYFLDSGEARKDWQFEARKWFKREREFRDSKPIKESKEEMRPQRDTRQPELEIKSTEPMRASELIRGIMSANGLLKGGKPNGLLENTRGSAKKN